MCGIYGTFTFRSHVDLQTQINRLDLLKHRGPDGFGFELGDFLDNNYVLNHNKELSADDCHAPPNLNYFLGHRRLSIVDLDPSASQPMVSHDDNYSLIFNGEIYNYIELRQELLALGSIFKTDHSDTEVLLNAYAVWGEKCLQKLRGMFAFAVFDRVNKRVFIARDRIGQKNVYYELNDSEFVFSSEIPPMVRWRQSPREVNVTALSYYSLLGYVPYPLSIFSGIYKLPPASFATLDLQSKTFSIQEYWDIGSDENVSVEAEEYEKQIENHLSESVCLRLRADVPVGAFISGGIDSSLIVRKIKEVGKRKFHIFGADFPQPEKSELKYIKQVAACYDQELRISKIDIDHIRNIENVINIFDEPFDGGSSVSLYELFKQAAKEHKVILTGDGGDEMFAGYDRYQMYSARYVLFSWLNKMKLPKLFLRALLASGITSRKLKKLARVIDSNIAHSYLNYDCDLSLLKMLRHDVGEEVKRFAVFDCIKEKIEKFKLSPVKALQYLELKTILPGRMLYKLDRFSMAYSVEARSPFLDHQLVEMAFSIPDRFNVDKSGGKVLLKKILGKDFPEEFVHRKKQGFGNPFSAWFSHSDSRNIFDIVNDSSSLIFKYFDYEKFHQEFPQFKNGYEGDREKEMWRFLVLANYLRNYQDVIKC